jgi:hypothetical protein
VQTVYTFVTGIPPYFLDLAPSRAWLGAFLFVLGVLLTGSGVRTALANRRARLTAQRAEDEAADRRRLLRITADDQGYLHAWRSGEPYVPQPRPVAPTGIILQADGTGGRNAADGSSGGNVLDARTLELVVDPTLSAAEVAEMVAHVEHGTGSVATVAATAEDTKLRGPQALARLQAAEVDAYAEAQTQEARLAVNEAFSGSGGMWADLDRKLWAIAPWIFYAHDDEGAQCPHCATALSAVSGEYRKLTERTEEIDRRELEAMLAAA